MIEFIGILGSLCFMFSNIPALLYTLNTNQAQQIPVLTQWLLFFGATFILVYLLLIGNYDIILLSSYLTTSVSWFIMLIYYYKG
jgi:uncharacterized protein with PQ loop repeat